ncbi:MAG: hypothetical protein IPK96_01415 [Flammeovirgaceae bacterium]|nr:hypothetical protein [Flammeovirgaceae bacterium]
MEHSRILRFLRWFCPPQLLEEIEGDLLQRYERDAKTHNQPKAKRKLLWNVVRFSGPVFYYETIHPST